MWYKGCSKPLLENITLQQREGCHKQRIEEEEAVAFLNAGMQEEECRKKNVVKGNEANRLAKNEQQMNQRAKTKFERIQNPQI